MKGGGIRIVLLIVCTRATVEALVALFGLKCFLNDAAPLLKNGRKSYIFLQDSRCIYPRP